MGMGITRAMAEHALQVTGNRSVEEAAEWIFTSTHDGVPGEIGADGGAPQTHAQQHDIEERALVPMMVLLRGVSQASVCVGVV